MSEDPFPINTVPAAGRPAGRRGTRDRHDRGMRGPAFGDTPLAPGGVPARRTGAERFDDIALRVMRAVVGRWAAQLGDLDLAVEEVPVITAAWTASTVPLASYVARSGPVPPRLVLFRRPLEHRVESAFELEGLLLTVIVEQVAEILGLPAEDVHPGYEAD
jgi:predicted Zn-dependent protease with MMP-like domain